MNVLLDQLLVKSPSHDVLARVVLLLGHHQRLGLLGGVPILDDLCIALLFPFDCPLEHFLFLEVEGVSEAKVPRVRNRELTVTCAAMHFLHLASPLWLTVLFSHTHDATTTDLKLNFLVCILVRVLGCFGHSGNGVESRMLLFLDCQTNLRLFNIKSLMGTLVYF